MSDENNLIIKVYSNEDKSKILDSFTTSGNVHEIEHDLLDGEDWWEDIIYSVEEKFDNKWSSVLISRSDQRQARVLSRSYCINGEIDNFNFTYFDKLFLIGKKTSSYLTTCFSQNVILNYKMSKIDDIYYQKGSDENIISLIRSCFNYELDHPYVVDVIYNPNPNSILMMKLKDDYKFLVHIPTKEKLNELIGLNKSYTYSCEILDTLDQAESISECYQTNELNFLLPALKTIREKINSDSESSYFNTFLRDFCI